MPGNEAADGAATRGARASSAGRGLTDLVNRIENNSYIIFNISAPAIVAHYPRFGIVQILPLGFFFL